jgi:crotonobetainyl-CoA:carnitine CoA-transferase CaiB-like acyl-CoA transferase
VHQRPIEEYRGTGIPVKLSDTPGAVRTKPPAFNADGDQVLRDYGFTADEIAALREAGVLVSERRKL